MLENPQISKANSNLLESCALMLTSFDMGAFPFVAVDLHIAPASHPDETLLPQETSAIGDSDDY